MAAAATTAIPHRNHEDDDSNNHIDISGGTTTAGPSRDMWRTRREKYRLVARYQIRQRVAGSSNGGDENIKENLDHTFGGIVENIDQYDTILASILLAIVKGDRSKFSLSFMDRYHSLLSSTVEMSRFVKLTSNCVGFPRIYDHALHVVETRSGTKQRENLQRHLDVVQCFTFYEFASWVGRPSIVSSLILGGISPTRRGCYITEIRETKDTANDTSDEHANANGELTKIGGLVLQRFFDSFPVRLSTYIVVRMMETRWNAFWVTSKVAMPEKEEGTNTERSICPLCKDTNVTVNSRSTFLPCEHSCCESCTWKKILSCIDGETSDDVFSCPICQQKCEGPLIDLFDEKTDIATAQHSDLETPTRRRELSHRRFYELPRDQMQLKQQSKKTKKKKPTEASYIARSWQTAILPSLGSSQDIRSEKFTRHVDQDALHYVKACLEAGVNIDGTNEYGQTPLHVAVWHQSDQIIQLLLDYGADPTTRDNGGLRPFDLDYTQKWTIGLESRLRVSNEIELPRLYHSILERDKSTFSTVTPSKVCRTDLIPYDIDHPGAGAFMIDNALTADSVDALLDLFYTVPVHPHQKLKKQEAPCSDRSYYCDMTGVVQQVLERAIMNAELVQASENDVKQPMRIRFFPYMRFLNYKSSGIVLPPHIDLCRTHRFRETTTDGASTGESKETVVRRSTHTFILYLTDCFQGGATRLLEDTKGRGRENVLSTIEPRRGRLLIFPHATPHEGLGVLDVPKILLRGEVCLLSND